MRDRITAAGTALLPRFIRARDAHGYCGMCRAVFNQTLRPYLTEIPIGKQGIAFDRLDLDAWADKYKSRNGCPGKEEPIWQEGIRPVSTRLKRAPGKSTNSSKDMDALKRAVEQANSAKQKRTSKIE